MQLGHLHTLQQYSNSTTQLSFIFNLFFLEWRLKQLVYEFIVEIYGFNKKKMSIQFTENSSVINFINILLYKKRREKHVMTKVGDLMNKISIRKLPDIFFIKLFARRLVLMVIIIIMRIIYRAIRNICQKLKVSSQFFIAIELPGRFDGFP